MRKHISVLVLIFSLSPVVYGSVLESRGFLDEKCYTHLVKIEKKDSNCSIVIAAHSTRALSINLVTCPTAVNGLWYFARFQIHIGKEKASTAEWLQGFEVQGEMIEMMQLREDGISHPISCH